AIDLRPVVAGGRCEEAHPVLDPTALGVGRAIIEPADAGERHRHRAHRARLERHIEIAVGESLGHERGRRLPDRQHLAMGGRTAIGERPVVRPRDHHAVAHDRAADRHLARRRGDARLFQRDIHERGRRHRSLIVMAGLVPAIHAFIHHEAKTWMPGMQPGMTVPEVSVSRDRASSAAGERIAKVMARAGLCSRREAEAWIAAGRVSVNGEAVASPARNVTAEDRVTVDGEPLPQRERTRLFLYHKQRELVTTRNDPQGRPTIFDALPKDLPRLLSVGRLDMNTEGLLLLTNDGGLARILELPATGWLRRYRVRAHGRVPPERLPAPARGSATGRSTPGWSASRAPMCGSCSPCARARTARSRTCSAISGSR